MHWKILAAVGWVGLMSSIGHATPEEGARGPWALELVGAWLPDQPEQAFCNREADCLSQARTFVGGALRASWRGTWGAVAATAGVARAVDLEGRPAAFGVLALRIDAQFVLQHLLRRGVDGVQVHHVLRLVDGGVVTVARAVEDAKQHVSFPLRMRGTRSA